MSNDLNQCSFIGRLGKDVEMRQMPSGDSVASFSIAVGKQWKTKEGEKKEQTTWINVVAFKSLADICGKYLKKGSKVFIGGELRIREYEKDGSKRYASEIVADKMQMLDGKPADGAQRGASAEDYRAAKEGRGTTSAPPADDAPFESDDIQF